MENSNPIDEPKELPLWLRSEPSFKAADRFAEGCAFWSIAWLGTAIAGGAFGVLVGLCIDGGIEKIAGMILGLFVGFIFAGLCAIPIHLHLAFFMWAFWLSRFRLAMAVLAGGLTGVLATKLAFSFYEIAAAGAIGAIGSGLLAFKYSRAIAFRGQLPEHLKAPVWQFTLRDLFVHFTAVALLISFWTTILTLHANAQKPRIPKPPPPVKELINDPSGLIGYSPFDFIRDKMLS
jgi:hypothetical protein